MMDQRKFQRHSIIVQQQVLHVAGKNIAHNRVLSKNVSASGFCFTSSQSYDIGETVFVHLNGQVTDEVAENLAGVFKAGNYFLARVVWCREGDNNYEIGCAFVGRQEANPLTMDLFTRCLNQYSVDNLKGLASPPPPA